MDLIVSLVTDHLKTFGKYLKDIFWSITPFLISIGIMVGLLGLKALLRRFLQSLTRLFNGEPTEEDESTERLPNKILSGIWELRGHAMDFIQKHFWEIFKEEPPETPLSKIWHFFWILIIFSAGLIGLSSSLDGCKTFDPSETSIASETSDETHLSIRIASGITTMVYLFVLQSLFRRLLTDHPKYWGFDLKLLNKIWAPTWTVIILIFGIISMSASLNTLGISAAFAAGVLGISFQTPLRGIAGWLMLMTCRPFKQGDRVKIGNIEGKVDNITVMSVVLKETNETDTGTVYVPSSTLFDQAITNLSSDGGNNQ